MVVAGSVMLFVGLSIGNGKAEKVREAFRSVIDQNEVEYQRVVRMLEKTKSETRSLSNFMVHMPDFARQINTNIERAKVAPMIVGILDQMFGARQIVVFYANDQRPGELYLAESKGVLVPGRGPIRVKIGESRIGWIAEHQVTMEVEEFQAHARAKWSSIEQDPAGMKLDLFAPMMHDTKLDGVLAVGGMTTRHPEEKKMLKMIADLGSSALYNANLIETIRTYADLDGLTQVLNKRAFLQRLSIQIIDCEKERAPLAVFILDVDHFKHYNDTNGHLAGDEVLRSVGKLLKKAVRSSDVVARYGGEEFIVAMPDTDLEGAMEAAQKIRREIQDHRFPNEEKQPLGDLTISGGIGLFPEDGRSATELIGHADEGLYLSKEQGRNRVSHTKRQGLGGNLGADDQQGELVLPTENA